MYINLIFSQTLQNLKCITFIFHRIAEVFIKDKLVLVTADSYFMF